MDDRRRGEYDLQVGNFGSPNLPGEGQAGQPEFVTKQREAEQQGMEQRG